MNQSYIYRFLLLVTLQIFAIHAHAQLTFQRTYGGNKNDYTQSLIQSKDTGFVMSGSCYGFGASIKQDTYIIKTNDKGDTLWTRLYRDPNNNISGTKIQETFDGGYIFTGFGAPVGETSDIYLTKINSLGNIQWSYNYGQASGAFAFGEHGNDVKQTPDSGYVVVGDATINGVHDAYIIRVDKNGTLLWTRTWGGSFDDAAVHVENTVNGGFVVSGLANGSSPLASVSITKFTANGTIQWANIYQFPTYTIHSGIDIKQLPDYGFLLTGITNNGSGGSGNAYLLRTDSSGNILWSKKYGTLGNDLILYTITLTTKGPKGFFVSGTTNQFGLGMYDNIMMRLDTGGNIIWARTVGGTDTEYGGFGIQTYDGGFAIVAQGKSYGAGMMDYYLIKTDSMGFSGCNQTSPNVPVTIMNPTKGTLPNTGSGGSRRTPGVFVVNPPTIIDSICCAIPIVNYTANDTTICGNSLFTIGTSSQPGMHYLWRPGATLNDSTIANPTASPVSPTTYTVFVYTDCGDTITNSVTISTLSSPTVTVAPSSSIQICQGDSAVLSASGTGSYLWSTGSTNTTINVSPTGSTIYTVTLSNGQCGDTANVNITLNLVSAAVTGDTTICKGSATLLSASGGMTYSWSNGVSNSSINVSPTIFTTYILHSFNGSCVDSSQINVYVNDPPVAEAGSNTSIILGTSVTLSSSGGTNCSWTPASNLSCTNCCSPEATPVTRTTYYVTITDANGCTSIDSIVVDVRIECDELVIPNAFSPNEDGNNDKLKIYSSTGCMKEFTLTIYNRWGEKVYVTTDPHFEWDGIYNGEQLSTQVLVYSINGLLMDSSTISKSGNISLMR